MERLSTGDLEGPGMVEHMSETRRYVTGNQVARRHNSDLYEAVHRSVAGRYTLHAECVPLKSRLIACVALLVGDVLPIDVGENVVLRRVTVESNGMAPTA